MIYLCMLLMGVAATWFALAGIWFVTDAPAEDRSYLDRPPLPMRLAWPVIQALASRLEWVLPLSLCARWKVHLVAAGLEFVMSPAQLMAARILVSALVAGVSLMLTSAALIPAVVAGVLAFCWPGLWLRRRILRRQNQMVRDLPFLLDQIAIGVEAGLSLSMAIAETVKKGRKGALVQEFDRYLRDVRAGRRRAEALQQMAERINLPAARRLVSSINTAERMGASLGQTLRIQADQRRMERFQRAEKLALEAPVKLLGPLILFIFPNTFIIIGFPVVMKFLHEGL